MEGKPTLVNLVINKIHISHALIDNGFQCYAAISENISDDINLRIIPISRREFRGASGAMIGAFIRGVTYANVEIRGHSQTFYFYVVSMLEHPVILGEPWMRHNKAYPIPYLNIIRHELSGNDIPTLDTKVDTPIRQEI